MRISCRQLRNAWFLLVLQAFAHSPCPPVSAVSECLFSITFTSIPSISHSAHAKSGNACNGNGFQAFSGVFGAVRRMWQMLVLVMVFKHIYKFLGPAPACQNAWFCFTLQAYPSFCLVSKTLCGMLDYASLYKHFKHFGVRVRGNAWNACFTNCF